MGMVVLMSHAVTVVHGVTDGKDPTDVTFWPDPRQNRGRIIHVFTWMVVALFQHFLFHIACSLPYL